MARLIRAIFLFSESLVDILWTFVLSGEQQCYGYVGRGTVSPTTIVNRDLPVIPMGKGIARRLKPRIAEEGKKRGS